MEGSGLREQREHNDPLFDTLRQSLAQLDDYEMLLVDDALMGISEGSSAAVKTHRRTDFRRKLGLRETAVFVPRISQWGPASAYRARLESAIRGGNGGETKRRSRPRTDH